MANTTTPDMVTVVIEHHVKPDLRPRYEQWLKRIIPEAARFPGHRGVNVIRPHGDAGSYTVALRFDALGFAQDWLGSQARQELIEEVMPLLVTVEKIDTVTGLEFWFTPPAGQKRARPYKQFLLTVSVIYPLTILVPWLLGPLFAAVPALHSQAVSRLIVAIVIVGLMTYVVMPRYTRLVHRWLFA